MQLIAPHLDFVSSLFLRPGSGICEKNRGLHTFLALTFSWTFHHAVASSTVAVPGLPIEVYHYKLRAACEMLLYLILVLHCAQRPRKPMNIGIMNT